jgi:hypothetical protein
MSDFETGVLNPAECTEAFAISYFNVFNRAFDDTSPAYPARASYELGYERRLRDARLIAFDNVIPPSCRNNRSHISLAAHWADDEPDARRRSHELSTLAATFTEYAGQAVVRFMNCDYDDAFDPEQPLRLEIARTKLVRSEDELIGAPSISHALSGLIPEARPDEYRDVLLAKFGVMLPVELGKQVLARAAASGKMASKRQPVSPQAAEAGFEQVLARSGIVSLNDSESLYRKTKQEKVETLLFGDEEANALIAELASFNPRVYDRFQATAGDDGKLFDAKKPFPDLSFLTARKADSDHLLAAAEDTESVLSSIDDLLNEIGK